MEHSIEFSMQKGKEWAYKNKYHILENQFIVSESTITINSFRSAQKGK
jgi:hypothetical protein